MSTEFQIASRDPHLLQQATEIANRFADGFKREMVREFTPQELERRRGAFMRMWCEMPPVVEAELGTKYAEINALV